GQPPSGCRYFVTPGIYPAVPTALSPFSIHGKPRRGNPLPRLPYVQSVGYASSGRGSPAVDSAAWLAALSTWLACSAAELSPPSPGALSAWLTSGWLSWAALPVSP